MALAGLSESAVPIGDLRVFLWGQKLVDAAVVEILHLVLARRPTSPSKSSIARLRAERRRVRRARLLAAIFGLITFLAVLATVVAYLQPVGVWETLGRSV